MADGRVKLGSHSEVNPQGTQVETFTLEQSIKDNNETLCHTSTILVVSMFLNRIRE